MKKVQFFIISFIFINSALARGYRILTTNIILNAPTERKVLQKTQEIIPTIRDFSNKQIRQFAFENSCKYQAPSSKYFKINGVDIDKMYKVEGNFLIPYYRAKLGITLNKCRDRD